MRQPCAARARRKSASVSPAFSATPRDPAASTRFSPPAKIARQAAFGGEGRERRPMRLLGGESSPAGEFPEPARPSGAGAMGGWPGLGLAPISPADHPPPRTPPTAPRAGSSEETPSTARWWIPMREAAAWIRRVAGEPDRAGPAAPAPNPAPPAPRRREGAVKQGARRSHDGTKDEGGAVPRPAPPRRQIRPRSYLLRGAE